MLVLVERGRLHNLCAAMMYRKIELWGRPDARYLVWVDDRTSKIEWICAYDLFFGKTCQIHLCRFGDKPAPKGFMITGFQTPFMLWGIETLLGMVESNNERALSTDLRMGFTHILTYPEASRDGHDVLLLRQHKSDCPYLKYPFRYTAPELVSVLTDTGTTLLIKKEDYQNEIDPH